MTLSEIVNAWRSNSLPQDEETLMAWKNHVDAAEEQAFQNWRTATCKTSSVKLVDDHVTYHDVSMAIMKKIQQLKLEKPLIISKAPRSILWKRH